MKLILALALCVAQFARAVDVPFSLLVAQNAVVNFGIDLAYKNTNQTDFVPYRPQCDNTDVCPELNWDDDAELQIKLTSVPSAEDIEAVSLKSVGGKTLGTPVQFKIQGCFETPFTKNRKWRKAKDIIQDDKRCAKKLVGKRDLPTGGSEDLIFTIKSDMPKARFFLTLFVFCAVEGENGNEYCAIDTTASLENLAKAGDVRKRLPENSDAEQHIADLDAVKSGDTSFRTNAIDSRPAKLVVSVVVLSALSVTMLVLYFVYERVMKKTA